MGQISLTANILKITCYSFINLTISGVPNVSYRNSAAVKTISDAGRGLYGLANNAGVLVSSPLIEINEQEFNFQRTRNTVTTAMR